MEQSSDQVIVIVLQHNLLEWRPQILRVQQVEEEEEAVSKGRKRKSSSSSSNNNNNNNNTVVGVSISGSNLEKRSKAVEAVAAAAPVPVATILASGSESTMMMIPHVTRTNDCTARSPDRVRSRSMAGGGEISSVCLTNSARTTFHAMSTRTAPGCTSYNSKSVLPLDAATVLYTKPVYVVELDSLNVCSSFKGQVQNGG